MQIPVLLACGPDGAMLLLLGAFAITALAGTFSFLTGVVFLFTSKWKLGIWMTALPLLFVAAFFYRFYF